MTISYAAEVILVVLIAIIGATGISVINNNRVSAINGDISLSAITFNA